MDEKQKVLDILNKFSFILGQRAGRELWFDKSEEVQNEDLSNFNKDIKYIKNYIENSNPITWHKVADDDLPTKSGEYLTVNNRGRYEVLRYCVEDNLGPYDEDYDFEKDDNMMNLKRGFNIFDSESCEFFTTDSVVAWMEISKYE
jgi:hypothetical protein